MEGKQHVCRNGIGRVGTGRLYENGLQLATVAFKAFRLADLKGHAAFLDKRPHLRNRVRRGAEIITAMHQRHRFGDINKIDRPVQRGIPASGDDKPLTGQRVALAHRILNAATGLKGIKVAERGTLRHKGSAAGGNHHDRRMKTYAFACRQYPGPVTLLFERLGHLPVRKDRIKGRDLFHQTVGQILAPTDQKRRDVIDRSKKNEE